MTRIETMAQELRNHPTWKTKSDADVARDLRTLLADGDPMRARLLRVRQEAQRLLIAAGVRCEWTPTEADIEAVAAHLESR